MVVLGFEHPVAQIVHRLQDSFGIRPKFLGQARNHDDIGVTGKEEIEKLPFQRTVCWNQGKKWKICHSHDVQLG